MIQYEEPLIRPPSEADALILQVTLGCSHNRCAFCVTYQDKPFRVRPPKELFAEIDWAAQSLPKIHKVFLADGDALVLSTDRLLAILHHIKERLPSVRRVSAYASPGNFRHKTAAELEVLRAAGLNLLYVGLESGDDEVLQRIDKGANSDEMVALLAAPTAAGMKLSVTLVMGLGGPRLSEQHAVHSAHLINRIKPRFASALMLMLAPRTPSYAEAFADPAWRLLKPSEFLAELHLLVTNINENGIIFHANHASNYVPIRGVLQKDKQTMLAALDAGIEDPRRRMPEYFRGL